MILTKKARIIKAFVDRYDIKGKVAASLMGINLASFYQKMAGSHKTTQQDIDNLKNGYFTYLAQQYEKLTKELKK
jgi:hypothetical protein